MKFFQNELYHIYNRGNDRRKIFFSPRNYDFFLGKVSKFLLPYCDILSYCLMPNHFHFLVSADARTIATKIIGGQAKNVLCEGVRSMLSSYALGINRERNRTGSLFQQNTKASPIAEGSKLYDVLCFHYIHQNPLKANLVKRMEDWEYSSFRDYCGLREKSICNRELAVKLLGLDMKTFYEDSYRMIDDDFEKYFL